ARGQFTGHANAGALGEILRQRLGPATPERAIKPDGALVLTVAFFHGDRPAQHLVAVLRGAQHCVFANVSCDSYSFHAASLYWPRRAAMVADNSSRNLMVSASISVIRSSSRWTRLTQDCIS